MLSFQSYDEWRASVPFTDDQIAAALEQCAVEQETLGHTFLSARYRRLADRAREGHVYSQSLRLALPLLVTHCALCDRKALYRRGTEGRCQIHKSVGTVYDAIRQERVRQRDQFFDELDAKKRRADRKLAFLDAIRRRTRQKK